jgi:eukaryotic-like serine/threonine-protein kinase
MPTPTPPPPHQRQIFLGALEIATSSDRITYIERECQGDATLRSAVDQMLEESDQLGSFLEQPPAVELQTWRDGKSSDHIGPYKLLQEIGEGGCGVVYMAEQERPVRRRVALKVIKLGMDTKSVIARFESGRQALAMMDHPNIAKVLDAGATENGRPYFVMELVRGVRITDYCDQHKLSPEDRLRLFVQVSQAIQHAHQKGIIHRDIKPSNILVTLHDGVPVPKIIDFGIAKAVDQRLTNKTPFTEFQSFISTPAYMSPEQAEMTGLDIETRSDIYSLGVILYELLVGSTPFDPKTLRDAGLDECRRTIREEEPAKPSQRLSTLVNADRETIAGRRVTNGLSLINRLQGDLDWIVMKCLEKDRQRRYATTNALALDVQCYMDGSMVSARPPSTVYRLQKAWRRNRLVFVAASAVITALVLGIGASTYLAIRATNAEQESTELRVAAEASLAQAIESTSRARLNEYVADMNVANHSLQDGNFGRAWQLIEKHDPEPETEDLRGFEWRYLAHRSQGDNHLAYPMQGAAIESLAFSDDGILLAAGMDDETKVWDVRTPVLPHKRGHRGAWPEP